MISRGNLKVRNFCAEMLFAFVYNDARCVSWPHFFLFELKSDSFERLAAAFPPYERICPFIYKTLQPEKQQRTNTLQHWMDD